MLLPYEIIAVLVFTEYAKLNITTEQKKFIMLKNYGLQNIKLINKI